MFLHATASRRTPYRRCGEVRGRIHWMGLAGY
jgi:hypothetical protein